MGSRPEERSLHIAVPSVDRRDSRTCRQPAPNCDSPRPDQELADGAVRGESAVRGGVRAHAPRAWPRRWDRPCRTEPRWAGASAIDPGFDRRAARHARRRAEGVAARRLRGREDVLVRGGRIPGRCGRGQGSGPPPGPIQKGTGPPRANQHGHGPGRVFLLARARPRRGLRPDPSGPLGPRSTERRRPGWSRSPANGSPTWPKSWRTTLRALSSWRSRRARPGTSTSFRLPWPVTSGSPRFER